MPNFETWYEVDRSERSIFTEIYFPKRAAYQSAIFNALRHGYDQQHVKKYLSENVEALVKEFQSYPSLYDPHNYSTTTPRDTLPTVEEAEQRIAMYKSPFKGWSVNSVDGVFFGKRGKLYEEATQVIRIMFRFKSSFTKHAARAHCEDVLRAILFWTTSQQGRLNDHKRWSKVEQAQFMARHEPWPSQKRAFAEQYFTRIAREVTKWIDDRALFIFGYLVRQFWKKVLKEKLYEAEIWVTDLFDPMLNVIERVQEPPQP